MEQNVLSLSLSTAQIGGMALALLRTTDLLIASRSRAQYLYIRAVVSVGFVRWTKRLAHLISASEGIRCRMSRKTIDGDVYDTSPSISVSLHLLTICPVTVAVGCSFGRMSH